jgi:hypothetical protein
MTDPFATLGLPARPDLTDEHVRAAWRAIAEATHPDRPDGGDTARYTAASAAYTILRTGWGRSEAWADLPPARRATPGRPVPVRPQGQARARSSAPRSGPPRPVPRRSGPLTGVVWLPARVWHGRRTRLAVRVLAAATAATVTVLAGAGTPATAAVLTGIATWLLLTARGDLAPPPGR